MPIFPYGLINKKANQALEQALLDLLSAPQAEQEALQRAKLALEHGANPNHPVNTQISSAHTNSGTHPLEIGVSCVNAQLIEMLLEHGAYKTGGQGAAAMWIKQAMLTMGVPKSQDTSATVLAKEKILKIGRLFVQHDFFMNSLDPDILLENRFYFYLRADCTPSPAQSELIFQILVDASTPKNIKNLQKLSTWHGWEDVFSVINLCVEKKKSADLNHVLTKELDKPQTPGDPRPTPARCRKI